MRDRPVRYQARYQARLAGETAAKLNALSATFHCTRAAMLRLARQWGLTQTRKWTVDTSIPPPRGRCSACYPNRYSSTWIRGAQFHLAFGGMMQICGGFKGI
jgi:hypothetical protein